MEKKIQATIARIWGTVPSTEGAARLSRSSASELRRLQTETEAELAAFTPALLAKAFRGEL
jgi:hypothetical protein